MKAISMHMRACAWWHQHRVAPVLSSRVKIYPQRHIEQCAAEPPCPVRGVVGCKQCSSTVSCVG